MKYTEKNIHTVEGALLKDSGNNYYRFTFNNKRETTYIYKAFKKKPLINFKSNRSCLAGINNLIHWLNNGTLELVELPIKPLYEIY